MVCEKSHPLGLRHLAEFFGGVRAADLTCAGKFVEFGKFIAALRRHIAVFTRIECVCGGIEDIAAHCDGKRKHRRVTCAEEVDT